MFRKVDHDQTKTQSQSSDFFFFEVDHSLDLQFTFPEKGWKIKQKKKVRKVWTWFSINSGSP